MHRLLRLELTADHSGKFKMSFECMCAEEYTWEVQREMDRGMELVKHHSNIMKCGFSDQ